MPCTLPATFSFLGLLLQVSRYFFGALSKNIFACYIASIKGHSLLWKWNKPKQLKGDEFNGNALSNAVTLYFHIFVIVLLVEELDGHIWLLNRLKDISTPDFSTPSFNPGFFNPRLFNHELSTPDFSTLDFSTPSLKTL